ncbi:MAG: DUF721 domain-containing protein [Candidatus Omnitrophica bacterium]|nr:DUF721 domain-containing protein [Candidatus Omnitrophota bacterium]
MAAHIKQLIDEFLKQKNKNLAQQKTIETIVERFLTPAIKNHIHLKMVEQNNLVFSSDSSGAAYNLNLVKKEILQEIQKQFPEVEKISVKTGAK